MRSGVLQSREEEDLKKEGVSVIKCWQVRSPDRTHEISLLSNLSVMAENEIGHSQSVRPNLKKDWQKSLISNTNVNFLRRFMKNPEGIYFPFLNASTMHSFALLLPYDLTISLLGTYSRETKTYFTLKKNLYVYVHSIYINNRKKTPVSLLMGK